MKISVLKTKNPYLNLAIEEYLLKYSDEDFFLLWQNEPTVVIGKNQNAYAEINMNFIEEKNIHIARRITGGGAVYHDLGNVNFSYITNRNSRDIDFQKYTKPIIDALGDMGAAAALSGRNDLLIDGKKISGNAQTVYRSRVLHHGTLLFDSELDILSSALLVDEEKIKSKAIKSTRARVTNIKSYLKADCTTEDFIEKIKEQVILKYSAIEFMQEINEEILNIEKRNSSEKWIFEERDYISKFTYTNKKRYDFGTVALHFEMKNDTVINTKIEGDFFGKSDIFELEKLLSNVSLKNIKEKIDKITISDYIYGMTNEEFLLLLLNKKER